MSSTAKTKCQRCPTGREKRSTRTVSFSLEGTRWLINVCEQHGVELEWVIEGWGRLGEQVQEDKPVVFGPDYVSTTKRVAELRSRQVAEDRAVVVKQDTESDNIRELFVGLGVAVGGSSESIPVTRTVEGNPWIFTDHASERLAEHEVDIMEALHAASRPLVIRPGRESGIEVRRRGSVQVVVNPKKRVILTVSKLTEE